MAAHHPEYQASLIKWNILNDYKSIHPYTDSASSGESQYKLYIHHLIVVRRAFMYANSVAPEQSKDTNNKIRSLDIKNQNNDKKYCTF